MNNTDKSNQIPAAKRITRRGFLGVSAAVAGYGMGIAAFPGDAMAEQVVEGATATAVPTDAIRPFRVAFPQEALQDLKRRILATRWPTRETVTDASQGVRLATVQQLARYWTTQYDWRKVEARLNADAIRRRPSN